MFVIDLRSAEMLRSRYLLVIRSSGRIEKGTRHAKSPQVRGCPRNCKRQVRSLKTTGVRFGAFGKVGPAPPSREPGDLPAGSPDRHAGCMANRSPIVATAGIVRRGRSNENSTDYSLVSSFFGPPSNLEKESEREGIEVTARITLIDGLTFSGSYTYLQASGGDGLAEIRRPEHSGSVNVAYAYAEGRGLVNLGVIYNGEMQDFAFDAFTYAQSQVTLEEYTVVNLAAHYDVTENVRLFGRVENVLNEDYQEVFGFETAPVAAYGGVKIRLGGERESASLE